MFLYFFKNVLEKTQTLYILQLMKRSDITISFITLATELIGITGLFFVSYFLRSITDGIPFIQLRIPYISEAQFVPFVFF